MPKDHENVIGQKIETEGTEKVAMQETGIAAGALLAQASARTTPPRSGMENSLRRLTRSFTSSTLTEENNQGNGNREARGMNNINI
jgi:hypothetical protein